MHLGATQAVASIATLKEPRNQTANPQTTQPNQQHSTSTSVFRYFDPHTQSPGRSHQWEPRIQHHQQYYKRPTKIQTSQQNKNKNTEPMMSNIWKQNMINS